MSAESGPIADYDAPGTGPFYVYDAPTIERAIEHGCLDEDVETGDSIACSACVFPPVEPAPCECGETYPCVEESVCRSRYRTRVLPPAGGRESGPSR